MQNNTDRQNRNWTEWLQEHLDFPFEVERVDDEDAVMLGKQSDSEPFRFGHKFKVLSIDSEEDPYGILVKAREGRRIGYVPLCDLRTLDKTSKNNKTLEEYLDYFPYFYSS